MSTLSGAEPVPPDVILPGALGHLLRALAALTVSDMPAIAVIGGMAVNIRLSTLDAAHRATLDIDLVSGDDHPTAVAVLSRSNELARPNTIVVHGVEIDIIETVRVHEEDLDGLGDDAKLFIAGHRWALDTAQPVRITTVGANPPTVEVAVATAAGLIAAKSHAAGYPRAARRATKHGGDLYDIFRLVEVFDAQGDLRAQVAQAPYGLGRLVAQVAIVEFLTSPARAMRQMNPSATTALDAARIHDVMEPFVAALR
ncbi:MAG: nucleotidyl transferase AbiEii/AbiGii toxin family protein [Acidimicrobiales bacterium]